MTMDSTNEEEPAARPPVIELDAEDVTADAQASSPETPPPTAALKTSKSPTWVLAALVVGLLVGGWLYRDLISSYLPTNEMQSLKSRVETVESTHKTINNQLLAVSAAADQAQNNAASLEAAIKETASAQRDFSNRLSAAENAFQSLKTDLDSLHASITSSTSSGGTIDSGALASIGQRLDALEKDVASLKAGSVTNEDANIIGTLRQTLSDIRAKITAGTSYRSELERIVRTVPAVGGNDVLNAYADEGLPNPAGLAAELRNDIPTLPQPEKSASSAEGGYLGSFWNTLSSVVTIRDIGEADWQALARNCAGLAEKGNLAQAIVQIDQAAGEKPSAIARWRDRAAARLKLETALDEMSQAVERVIAARSSGQ